MMEDKKALFQKTMNEGHSAAWDQDWSAAAAAYKRALTYIPKHPSALSNLALAYYQLQQYEEALEAYKELAEVSPDDPIPYEKIAELSERLGSLKVAVTYFFKAADLYLKLRDVNKAIENWVNVVQIDPENIVAHSRLGLVYERLGRSEQAGTEYLALASLYQRRGATDKAKEFLQRAVKVAPQNENVRQALRLFSAGQLLPKPSRPKGGTGPIRMAKLKQLKAPKKSLATGSQDPISEARQRALTLLADILFEISDEDDQQDLSSRSSLQSLMRATGPLQNLVSNRSRIVLYLGQVIDSQMNGQDAQAADELESAMNDGFEHPAATFDLGLLRFQEGRYESALRLLKRVIGEADFSLAAHLLIAQSYEKMERFEDAAMAYMEALKLADAETVPPEKAAALRQLYEPVLETLAKKKDTAFYQQAAKNIREMLLQPDWRLKLRQARQSFEEHGDGRLLPLADLIVASQSGQILSSLERINQYARMGLFRTAMEEAYYAVSFAPSYLPLHSLIGDLLARNHAVDDAVEKYKMVARSYSIRGEPDQTTQILKKVVEIAPMDLNARRMLIDELEKLNAYEDAIYEYMNLADFYYRLAQLPQANEAYAQALRLAQKHSRNPELSGSILERMADISMQRLDWKKALMLYEQICSLQPDRLPAYKQVIDLSLRLGQKSKAESALRNVLSYLEGKGMKDEALAFLEDLAREQPDEEIVLKALATMYVKHGRANDAINILDGLAERKLTEGAREEAIQLINQIIQLNPPNVEDYQRLMATL